MTHVCYITTESDHIIDVQRVEPGKRWMLLIENPNEGPVMRLVLDKKTVEELACVLLEEVT